MKQDGACLQSQFSGGRGRRNQTLRFLATERVRAKTGIYETLFVTVNNSDVISLVNG